MNADLRRFSVVVLLLALMGCGLESDPQNEAEKQAVAAIDELGGEVSRNREGQLFRVNLNNTQISDTALEYLKGLEKLGILELANTRITDAGLVHLKALTNLTALNLSNTQVTDVGLEYLQGLTNLELLYLSDTKFSDNGLVHLKANDQVENSVFPNELPQHWWARVTG